MTKEFFMQLPLNSELITQRMRDEPGSRGRNSYVESGMLVENTCRSKGKGINFSSLSSSKHPLLASRLLKHYYFNWRHVTASLYGALYTTSSLRVAVHFIRLAA